MVVCIASWAPGSSAIEIAPLKKQYVTQQLSDPSVNHKYVYRFTRTNASADGFSVICDMRETTPGAEGEGEVNKKYRQGLRLELRARAMVTHVVDGQHYFYNTGFVVLVSAGVVMKSFNPPKPWFLPWWSNSETEIYLRDWSDSAKADSLRFDFLSGNGYYYEAGAGNPGYTLFRCRKISKLNLPVYQRQREDQP